MHAIVVSDTGSSDRTLQILYERSCHVIQNVWVDFSTNRNLVLYNARSFGKYILCGIDADEELVVPEGFVWPELTLDGYYLECQYKELRYPRLAIVSPSAMWNWSGVIHEVLDPQGRTIGTINGPYIRVGTGGARSRDPATQEKDLAVLQKAVNDNPDNARYRFYLARTCKDLGRYHEALSHYAARVGMPGWTPETAYAYYAMGVVSELLERDPTYSYMDAIEVDGARAEPYVALGEYIRRTGKPATAAVLAHHAISLPVPVGGLFVEQDVYEWRALDLFVTTAFYNSTLREEGRAAAHALLTRKFPENERARIETNCKFYTGA